MLAKDSYWRARVRFWWSCTRFDTWLALLHARQELVASWRDYRQVGDLIGHARAFFRWCTGMVKDSDCYKVVDHD